MKLYQAAIRGVAIAAATLLCFGAVLLREATSPSGQGFWTAMAAAPAGGLYLADEIHHRLLLIDATGSSHVIGPTPQAIYRTLDADGRGHLLLGTESGLFVSLDGGESWTFAIPSRRITAVAIGADYWLAGAWNDALYRSVDGGRTWRPAQVPAGDIQFEQAVPGFVATLLGLLHSTDGGLTWQTLPGASDRMTAVSLTGSTLDPIRAGDWYGRVWLYTGVRLAIFGDAPFCQGGIWSLELTVVATTQGLCPKPRSGPALLSDHEITGVVRSASRYFASVARGDLYVSDNGRDWHLAYQR